jgi:hypothetical protein
VTEDDDATCSPCEKARKEAVGHICRVAGDGASKCEEELLSILKMAPDIGTEEAKKRFREKVQEIHGVSE